MSGYVKFLSRHALAICVAALVLFVAALFTATRLHLRSDFRELLPQEDPELKELQQIGDRLGGRSTLVVAVEGDDPGANERFAEALVANLQPLVGRDLRAIDYRPDATKAFFEKNKILYADLRDLRRADDDLRKLLVSKKNPAFVAFADEDLGEEKDNPEADLRRLKRGIEKRRGAPPFPSGYYETPDRKLLAIVTWTNSSGTGDLSGFKIRDDVQRVVDQTDPARFGVKAQLTGDVVSAIEEHDALKSDIEWVSLVCTVAVLLVIAFYYRGVIALTYIFFPTLLGVASAFAVAALTIGYLNTNTAFLGSIILGNGINFGIILLARYQEQRTRQPQETVEEALEIALRTTARPTLTAALSAAIAYGSLALTRFRGFQQFGQVGGVGMVLCWLVTYSYCPALVCFWERIHRQRPRENREPRLRVAIARAIIANHRALLAAIGILSALAVVFLAPVIRHPFEYDFSQLRNQRSRKHGAGDLYVRVGRIFPQDLAPTGIALLPTADDALPFRDALLVKDCESGLRHAGDPRAADPAKARTVCQARVAAGEPTGGLLSSVSTAASALPKDQDAKLSVVDDLRRRLADPAFQLLEPEQRKEIDAWAPPPDLRRLTIQDLPEPIARRFREVDGTLGRVALIYPVRVWANWDGHELIRMSDTFKDVRLPNGDVVSAAGNSSMFAAMLRSISHDGPLATEVALIGVVLLVTVLFRRVRSVVMVLSSLLTGMLWMAGAAAAINLKLNFLNFVALPITLGIGVDYAVNIVARLLVEPPESHPRALAETGSAVALCSLTTIIGYSSLFMASNGALRSFGKLADLGEVGCLLAAVLFVPSMIRSAAREIQRTPRQATDDTSNS
ncbi:MAG TPA: MMPL family transporter [Polyangia bacterium]|nr:MMPL family transporter [Polyangia bacterium]